MTGIRVPARRVDSPEGVVWEYEYEVCRNYYQCDNTSHGVAPRRAVQQATRKKAVIRLRPGERAVRHIERWSGYDVVLSELCLFEAKEDGIYATRCWCYTRDMPTPEIADLVRDAKTVLQSVAVEGWDNLYFWWVYPIRERLFEYAVLEKAKKLKEEERKA